MAPGIPEIITKPLGRRAPGTLGFIHIEDEGCDLLIPARSTGRALASTFSSAARAGRVNSAAANTAVSDTKCLCQESPV